MLYVTATIPEGSAAEEAVNLEIPAEPSGTTLSFAWNKNWAAVSKPELLPLVSGNGELLTTVCAGILTIDCKAATLRPAHVMRAAAENGYEDVIRILVANGGGVNAECCEDEGNVLQAAAIKGNETLIRCLLELGADSNGIGGELAGVLHIAAVNGDESTTGLLLENRADPNTKGGIYGFTLQAAVEEGHENIIRMLLDNGADVNLGGGPYGNAFQAAVENGDQDIVELLLAHMANINTMIGGKNIRRCRRWQDEA
ncbi:hypothetical protein CNMCM8927_008726 [Aspergillus lentulus]|uniref:Uncharacterized protein n=1 Tax=Aspergillus lentulus TaxID=293939 RepID=A0AAN5YV26_ASPLE|nr:hypothetical protein CNMCM8694_001059 [Aspergillus lentulus]KAF4208777.1 hypothetical protein CNMCM8927_008726 [Aspergillus lentulus]